MLALVRIVAYGLGLVVGRLRNLFHYDRDEMFWSMKAGLHGETLPKMSHDLQPLLEAYPSGTWSRGHVLAVEAPVAHQMGKKRGRVLLIPSPTDVLVECETATRGEKIPVLAVEIAPAASFSRETKGYDNLLRRSANGLLQLYKVRNQAGSTDWFIVAYSNDIESLLATINRGGGGPTQEQAATHHTHSPSVGASRSEEEVVDDMIRITGFDPWKDNK